MWYGHDGNNLAVPQKVKHLIYDQAISLLNIEIQEN